MTQETIDKLVKIEVSSDKLEASLLLGANINPQELTPLYVATRMGELGLEQTSERTSAVLEAIATYVCNEGKPLRHRIARGTTPTHGTDGRLVLVDAVLEKHETTQTTARSDTDTTTSIDQRERSSVRWTEAGAVIAWIQQATIGADGRDVFGRVLAARTGRVFEVSPDESVLVRADGACIALRAGVVEHSGRVLRVSNRLVIDGDIDFSTGNIRFPGDVEIARGIRDCFEVHAGGSIFVRDLVDAATMSCAHHMVLEKGIAARELGSLEVGKDLSARYLTNVRAVVGRDAIVEAEVQNCTLLIGRDMKSPGASIVRGDVSVARSCEIAELGAPGGAATTLRLGQIASVHDAMGALANAGAKARDRVDKANARLNELRSVKGRTGPDHAELLTEAQFEAQTAAKTYAKACRAGQMLHGFVDKHTKVHLVVRGAVHPQAVVHAGGWTATFTQTLKGPCVIEMDGKGELTVRMMVGKSEIVPLRKWARVVREEQHLNSRRVLEAMGIAA